MRAPLPRLIGALLLLGLNANLSPSPFGEQSLVIVHLEKIISSDAIDAIDPADADARITEWSNDAEFTVTSRLAGPDLGAKPRISFIDQGHGRSAKLFMVVHRDGRGRLWARRAWQAVDDQLCLSAQQVARLGLTSAFSTAQDNSRGQRCIDV